MYNVPFATIVHTCRREFCPWLGSVLRLDSPYHFSEVCEGFVDARPKHLGRVIRELCGIDWPPARCIDQLGLGYVHGVTSSSLK